MSQVQCNNKKPYTPYFSYYSSYEYWAVYPTVDPNPFIPRPCITIYADKYNNIKVDNIGPVYPRKYVSALLQAVGDIERLSTAIRSTILRTNNITSADTCQLKFLGRLTNAAGEAFAPVVNFKQSSETCNPTVFSKLVDESKSTLQQLWSASGAELRSLRYALDATVFRPSWLQCTQLVKSLFTTETKEIQSYGKACPYKQDTSEFLDDPCCMTYERSWSYSCGERPFTYQVEIYKEATEEQNLLCHNKRCASIVLNDYQALLQDITSPLQGCHVDLPEFDAFTQELLVPYRKCRDKYFGENVTLGVPCSRDSDCDAGYTCDLVRGACLYPVARQVELFLQCLLPQLDGFIVDSIERKYNITPRPTSRRGDIDYVKEWIAAHTAYDCTGETSLALPYRRHRVLMITSGATSTSIRLCGYCPAQVRCLDDHCTLPYECRPRMEGCVKSFRNSEIYTESQCRNARVCNWRPGVTSSSECDSNPNPYFCGFCEPSDVPTCKEVDTVPDEATCNSHVACVLANGSIIATPDVETCENTFSCTVSCWDADTKQFVSCPTEQACLSAGYCEDTVYFLEAGYDTACLAPAGPFRIRDCMTPYSIYLPYQDYSLLRPVPAGCMIFEYRNWSGYDACWYVQGKQINISLTEAECQAKGFGCREPLFADFYRHPEIHTPKDRMQCDVAGGIYEPYYKWTPGRWLGGQARPQGLQWLQRGMAYYKYNYTLTFDFRAFYDNLVEAIDAKYAYLLRSVSHCQYRRALDKLMIAACNCGGGGGSDVDADELSSVCSLVEESIVGQRSTPVKVAATVTCAGFAHSLTAPPARVYFDADAVSGSRCLEIEMAAISAGGRRHPESLSNNFLLNFVEDSEWQFRNVKKALVGQLVSDGLSMQFDPNRELKATICLAPRPDIPNKSSKYVVADFATSTLLEPNFAPLFANVTIRESGEFCATVKVQPGAVYWAVLRSEDSRDKPKFHPVESGVYVISATTYLVVLTFCIIEIIFNIKKKRIAESLHQRIVIFIIVGLLCLLRALFFILVVSGVLLDYTSTSLSFFLVELPSFIYFSTMTYFVVAWGLSLHASVKRVNLRPLFNKLLLAINLFMYIVFVSLFILYEMIKDDTVVCEGSVVDVDQTARRATSLTYRIMVAAFSTIITAVFLTLGTRVQRRMMAVKDAVAYVRNDRSRKLFWMTVVCSIGLVIQTVFLVVLAASSNEDNILATTVLLAVEALPCCFVVANFALSIQQATETTVVDSTRY